jgi:hypothetical protein
LPGGSRGLGDVYKRQVLVLGLLIGQLVELTQQDNLFSITENIIEQYIQ